jgi:ligand-binding sensor domain-containing protein
MKLDNKQISKRIVHTLLFVLVTAFAFSQNIKFKRISVEEGLSASSVNTIFQDSQDFIWIGTQDGLNRYDGYHIKTFKTNQNSKAAISSNFINCIFEDVNGFIYIGTNDEGLSVFNKYTETFTNYKAGLGSKTLSNNSIRSIAALNNNELLIATRDGLNVFNKSNHEFNLVDSKTSAFNLTAIFKDSKGKFFVSSYGNGFFEFDQKSNKLINYPIENSEFIKVSKDSEKQNIRCLTEINESIWCGTDEGILIFNSATKKFIKSITFGNEVDSKYNNRIVSFAKDEKNKTLWIGTWGGLIKYNYLNETFTIIKNNELDQNSISNDKISCILTDNRKNIWVGTSDKGVNIYFSSAIKFPLYNSTNGLTNDYIYSVIQTSDKKIWAGTEDGLYALKENASNFTDESKIINKYESRSVLSLLEDKNENLWIGTYGQGVRWEQLQKLYKIKMAQYGLAHLALDYLK